MTFEEAEKIFKDWKEYIEINDKLSKIFSSIPESFLPHPVHVLEEALNIIAKNYFDQGDQESSAMIQGNLAAIAVYKDDEEAVKDISDDLALKNLELRHLHIVNLKKARESWEIFKNKKNK